MKKSVVAIALAALVLSVTPFAAKAQDTAVPGHDRENEINQRLDDQGNRIDNGAASGQLNGNQTAHDSAADQHVSQEMSRDEAKDKGHITKKEQKKMNHQLNKNSKRIHRQRHAKPATTTPAQ